MEDRAAERRERMTVRRFPSHAAADAHDRVYWAAISPADRILQVWKLSREQWLLRATIHTVMSDESTPQPPQPSEMELLRAEMRAGFQSTRRHIDVVVESLRSDFQGVIDKTTATGKKVDQLIASNAVEHAAFLEAITDHEVRITRLEKG